MVKVHVGRQLHGHLAYLHISMSFSFCVASYVPKGPTISTVFGGLFTVTSCLRLDLGSRKLSSTPGGSDKGALPIRDLHLEVLENGLDVDGEDRAGTRKSGSSVETFLELARRQWDLNIIVCLR